jgi:cysteinyl-tRNA synthetase
MKVRLHDSLTGAIRDLETAEPGLVKMYACGPTVYLPAHIGNFRANVCWDVLRRALELHGWRVRKVMNITDVGHLTRDDTADGGEDKMEVTARKEGVDPLAVAQRYIDRFHRDRKALRIKDADLYPRATQHIPGMIALVEKLVARGHAYVVKGNVYFEVATFPGYGKLSKNTVERLVAGARIEPHPDKRHPADFALWKSDPDHLQQWDSPWGRGFPGWHIECSVMAMQHLGTETLDIHTGGEDHLFPHHECEIAQSEGATGVPFSRFWLHNRFMNVEGKKMSKSLGNFWTLDDLVAKGHDPVAVRYLLLSTTYRQPMNFTLEGLDGAAKSLERIRACLRNLVVDAGAPALAASEAEALEGFEERFRDAMADDLNTSAALAQVFDAVRFVNARAAWQDAGAARVRALFGVFDSILDVLREDGARAAAGPADAEIERLVKEREDARKAKDFARADAARKRLTELGVTLEDTPRGPRWTRK